MLEDLKPELKKAGNTARAQLIENGIAIAAGTGFKGDLFDVLVAQNKSLVQVLSGAVPVPTKALKLIAQVDTQLAEVANRKINDQLSWPYPAPASLGLAALKKAQNELKLWDKASFEERMQAIFKYLGDDSGYENWCAGFVSWCLGAIPQSQWIAKNVKRQSSLGALRLFEKFKQDTTTGTYAFEVGVDPVPDPQPGDIVFWKRANELGDFDAGFGHVGFVFSVNGKEVATLEGNNSMSVTLSTYKNRYDKSSKHKFYGVIRLP